MNIMKPARELIQDLLKSGLTQAQIGASIGINQASVSKIFQGEVSDVKYATGKRLEQLHQERASSEAV